MWRFRRIEHGQFIDPFNFSTARAVHPVRPTTPYFAGDGTGLHGLLPTPPSLKPLPLIKPPSLLQQLHPSVFPLIQFPNPLLPPDKRNPYTQNIVPAQLQDSFSGKPFSDLFRILLEEKLWDPNKHPHLQLFQTLPLNDQLQCFLSYQLLTLEQVRIRWQLAIDVLFLLRLTYPQCQVYVFGSLLTGLGDCSSDVDLYVDLCNDDGLCFQLVPARVESVRVARDQLHMVLWKSAALHTQGPFVDDIQPIGKDIPYLRFTHHLTNLKCDISVGSRIPVQNSELLRFYLQYDPRVGPLITFLRYWAKFHGIAGELHIKHYALSLLGIVYLTQKKILPSIYLLQLLAADERNWIGIGGNPDDLENWDTSFCQNTSLIALNFPDRFYTSLPEYSANAGNILLELAMGFFEMIAKLDLSTVVICPLLGGFISKEIFSARNEEDVPEPFHRAFPILNTFEHHRPLCIQDPFVLNFNVGRAVHPEIVTKFQTACQITLQTVWAKQGRPNSILDLFVPLPKLDRSSSREPPAAALV